ncbi:hypothetical protein EPA93_18975 [Ktedonosporobacter rubrisoli]|uniref:UspA domain-containing protein n=1 Tax=Ktedonosporobacter rubrisoli TaxID=2509675 RepID=A0A4P6JRP2_KTERU|nr:ArsB/NhaD family transporter [Ktedonosporobacter rubrisoli]QBD77965.1 hypothetical protein EPA93_18975 [Ktedonosporobacter rubrisoli]
MLLLFHVSTFTKTLLTILIAGLTLLGIMTRPFKWNEAFIALTGAALLLLLGLIAPGTAAITLLHEWNTFFFFLGMMSLSALAESAGIFDWLATQAAYMAKQSSARLFLNIFLLGCLISMILSNDATALILTPIVYTLVTRLRLSVLPFLFACTFIADTASFLLPVSNPINIIITSKFPLPFFTFLRLLFLPGLLVIGMNIAVFFLLYRRHLRGQFDIKRLPPLQEAIKHRSFFRYTCAILLIVAIAYIVASATQFPLSLIALGGTLLLFPGALFWKQSSIQEVRKQVSWSIFGFIAGMFIIVKAVEQTGLTANFGQLLVHLSGGSSFGAVMIGTLGAAIGTNLINNVPMAVVLTAALGGVHSISPSAQLGFVAASIFGCDLGPNLTTVGSLATVLWLLILRRRNLDISGLDYFKVGILVTPLMLAGELSPSGYCFPSCSCTLLAGCYNSIKTGWHHRVASGDLASLKVSWMNQGRTTIFLRRIYMRVLCCLDGTNAEQISNAISSFVSSTSLTLGLIYTIDTSPHGEIERQRERFLRPHELSRSRREQIQRAEQDTAKDILEEGLRYLPGAEQLQRQGRAEREIVNCAAEWQADLIVIGSRSPSYGVAIGPRSVGHIARFVLDHAPCPVLLLRPLAYENFPIPR